MKALVSEITPAAKEKQQTFTVDINTEIPNTLIADEGRLHQALKNILSNSVKFTDPGGSIAFKITKSGDLSAGGDGSARGDGEKCMIRFEISDNGIGISEEMQTRLWTPFEQSDNGITRAYGGTGLGLPITKRIIDLMGGTIQVESAPGKGSLFTCDIPLAINKKEQPGISISAGTETSAETTDLQNRKILIVDDVEMNREILLSLLEETGASLDCAKNGAEAVDMFSRNCYNVVLMDLHMPVMDGFEAASRIRQLGLKEALSAVIIAVTADTGSDVYNHCITAGMDDHTGKPVDYHVLMDLIMKHLDRHIKI
jgi:CheY-like chemotaxis protein